MNCKDCRNYKCEHPIYTEDAEYCDMYMPKRRDKTVRYKEYRITQSGYNLHTMIVKDNKMVYHAQTTEPLTRLELYRHLKRYLKFREETFGKIHEEEEE